MGRVHGRNVAWWLGLVAAWAVACGGTDAGSTTPSELSARALRRGDLELLGVAPDGWTFVRDASTARIDAISADGADVRAVLDDAAHTARVGTRGVPVLVWTPAGDSASRGTLRAWSPETGLTTLGERARPPSRARGLGAGVVLFFAEADAQAGDAEASDEADPAMLGLYVARIGAPSPPERLASTACIAPLVPVGDAALAVLCTPPRDEGAPGATRLVRIAPADGADASKGWSVAELATEVALEVGAPDLVADAEHGLALFVPNAEVEAKERWLVPLASSAPKRLPAAVDARLLADGALVLERAGALRRVFVDDRADVSVASSTKIQGLLAVSSSANVALAYSKSALAEGTDPSSTSPMVDAGDAGTGTAAEPVTIGRSDVLRIDLATGAVATLVGRATGSAGLGPSGGSLFPFAESLPRSGAAALYFDGVTDRPWAPLYLRRGEEAALRLSASAVYAAWAAGDRYVVWEDAYEGPWFYAPGFRVAVHAAPTGGDGPSFHAEGTNSGLTMSADRTTMYFTKGGPEGGLFAVKLP